MKKERKDTPYHPTTQIASTTPDIIREVFGCTSEKWVVEEEEDVSAATKKLRRGDYLWDYVSESACSAAAIPAFASTRSAAATPASASGPEAYLQISDYDEISPFSYYSRNWRISQSY